MAVIAIDVGLVYVRKGERGQLGAEDPLTRSQGIF